MEQDFNVDTNQQPTANQVTAIFFLSLLYNFTTCFYFSIVGLKKMNKCRDLNRFRHLFSSNVLTEIKKNPIVIQGGE